MVGAVFRNLYTASRKNFYNVYTIMVLYTKYIHTIFGKIVQLSQTKTTLSD